MKRLKYRTTLNDFRNRMKIFRHETDAKRHSNASRIDDTLRKLLFVSAVIDESFYNKMMKYHSMSFEDLVASDVISVNWL